MTRSTLPLSLLLVAGVALACPIAVAQEIPVFREVIDLDDERPETWAMNYFSAAVFPGPIEVTRPGTPWTIRDVSLEIGWLPELDLEQRTVGFDGLKEEDLNKLDLLPRPSVRIDLPFELSATLGWVPPLEVEGVEANLVLISLARPVAEFGGWRLHGRITGQHGTIDSDFTCPATVARLQPGPGNPWGCEETSADSYEIDQGVVEAIATRQLTFGGSPRIQLSTGYLHTDAEFQVDAVRTGFRDLTLLRAETSGLIATAGAFWSIPELLSDIGVVAAYSPIDVRRPRGVTNDPFFNLRLVVLRRF